MCELAKMFIHCLNHWKLETPNTWKQHQPNADLAQYRMNYTRYFLLYKVISSVITFLIF